MNNSTESHSILQHWIGKLGLQSWKIELLILPLTYDGHLDVATDSHRAIITLSDDVPIERTILHELLELSLYEIGEHYEILLDRAVTCRVGCEVLRKSMGHSRNRFINALVDLLLEERDA